MYPQRDGNLEISPLSLNLVLDFPTNKRDFFGNVIYDQTSQDDFYWYVGELLQLEDLPQIMENLIVFLEQLVNFEFDVILNKNSLKSY